MTAKRGLAAPAALETIIIATRNAGKARELCRLLAGVRATFVTLADHPEVALPPERGSSYRDNALAKARAVHEALGLAALGDDSGLEVDSLGGAPGVYSARFAGEGAADSRNNERLLDSMAHVALEERTARFRCALALVRNGHDPVETEGACEGKILPAPRGNGGFGYDPLFLPDGERLTFAELPESRKDAISHRARAAALLTRAMRHGD